MSTDRNGRPRVLYLSHAPEPMYALIRSVAGERFELLTLEGDRDEERIEKLAEADAVVVAATPFTRPMIEAATRLKVVHHQGVGYQDTIDMSALGESGAGLAITPAGTTIGVAEHTVLLALAVLRRLPFADAELRAGRWHINTLRLESGELHGRTIGYIGMGRIAREAARRFAGFGTGGVYFDPDVVLEAEQECSLGLEKVDFSTLLARADIVSVHVPLTAATHHLVDGAALSRMKPGAILINTARGPIVEEAALIEALRSGRLGGAGLDVFETEPPADTPLAAFRNVVLTPHISAGTRDALVDKMRHVFDNLERFFRGLPMENAIDMREFAPAPAGTARVSVRS